MTRTAGVLALSVLTGVALLAQSRPALAQQWEVEVHGGGLLTSHPRGGQAQAPPTGGTVGTFEGGTTPRVTSWYFGEGSALLNQLTSSLASPITPLDPVLRSSALERANGASVGVRVGRRLGGRLTAELAVDYNFARLELSRDSLAGIEASRASFIRAWSGPFFYNPSVSSDATIRARGGRQLLASGALNVSLAKGRTLEPYVTIGGGFVWNRDTALAATLVGGYQIRVALGPPFNITLPFNETDTVRLHFSSESSSFALLGLGVKYRLSPRWGVRLDVREQLSANNARTRLDSAPAAAVLAPPSALSVFAHDARVQFVNNPAAFGTESTLSGPAITNVETFKGTGLQSQLGISAGVFLRF
jgi:hypothetical protein